ncbi:MAG: DUF1223 domain-containing protein, partial [Cytophagales bacterium]|nr:DUF1223 domain-containing protein [Cytophagales bacterium]
LALGLLGIGGVPPGPKTTFVAPSAFAVVELFTSEGCSSCPPAERLVAEMETKALAERKPVFFLNFHVDYWNRLGWKDRFSKAAYTSRQRAYAAKFVNEGVYTPQMVVNGRWVFVGNQREEANATVAEALATPPKSRLELKRKGNRLQYAYTGTGSGRLWLAVSERHVATDVKAGENAGRRLDYQSVVVDLQSVGSGKTVGMFELPPRYAADQYRAVVFWQDEKTLQITAAAGIN